LRQDALPKYTSCDKNEPSEIVRDSRH
jgi:hypothetical protein